MHQGISDEIRPDELQLRYRVNFLFLLIEIFSVHIYTKNMTLKENYKLYYLFITLKTK